MDRNATQTTARRRSARLLTGWLAAALVGGACGSDGSSGAPQAAAPSPTAPQPVASGAPLPPASSEAGSGAAGGGGAGPSGTIPQPIVIGLPVGPDSARVDLAMPTFSNPTRITNPLFPVSSQASVLLLGQIDRQRFRTEVTLLPGTRIVDWAGQRVETLISQYVAYLDGRLHEVAYDLYAQADDGSVWYFGEDVFNFADGVIVDTHGTWLAGRDGPAAMIMPGNPRPGDLYRPENIPGLVFEEVTVKAVDQRLDGPLGPVEGGLAIEELHMDGVTENKIFAPGYGEFFTGGGVDVEALALAVPTDALTGAAPTELLTLEAGAAALLAAAGSKDWNTASVSLMKMTVAWDARAAGEVSTLIAARLTRVLADAAEAVEARNRAGARQAAIDAAQATQDLLLRYRAPAQIDLARFDLQATQLQVDADSEDAAGMRGDFFALDYIRDRIARTLSADDLARLNSQLEELLGAVGDENFAAAIDAAQSLRDTVAGLRS